MTKKEAVEAFLSRVIHGQMKNPAPRKPHVCNDSIPEMG